MAEPVFDDIRSLPKEEKFERYEKIGKDAVGVKVEEHKSGFPAITIDYNRIHLLTDVFSVEEWFKRDIKTDKEG